MALLTIAEHIGLSNDFHGVDLFLLFRAVGSAELMSVVRFERGNVYLLLLNFLPHKAHNPKASFT